MTITEIVSNIDRRIADVHAEVADLEGARVALLNGSPPAPAPKARRVRSKAPARSGGPAREPPRGGT
jgi:hypothetical protein